MKNLLRRRIPLITFMLIVVLMIFYNAKLHKRPWLPKGIYLPLSKSALKFLEGSNKTRLDTRLQISLKETNFSKRKTVLLKDGGEESQSRYKVIGFLPNGRKNQARLSPAVDNTTRELLIGDDFEHFHVVTTFVPFDHPDIRKGLYISGGGAPTDQEIGARMAEITDCLQRNLVHKCVSYVHVIVFREDTIKFLQQLDLGHSHKLIIHKDSKLPTSKNLIEYASKYLQKKTVVLSHQDNYMGEGWDKVRHETLRKQRLMYALTRHPSPSNCSGSFTSAHCGPGYPYIGSHDTFVFHVSHKVQNDELREVDFTPNFYGIENAIIWTFQKILKYKVLNPCKVLRMYHSHCVPIRDKNRKRINTKEKTGWAGFTNQLE